MNEKKWVVYLIRCSDKSLYCGITNNLKHRLAAHNQGKGAKYTRSRRPVELAGASFKMTKSDALKLEARIKKIPAGKKIFELTKGDNRMKNLKKDLQAVNKEIKALSNKVKKMIVTLEKLETGKPAKKVAVKKPAVAKKPAKLSAIATVLRLIQGSPEGIDTATLIKMTRFANAKIHMIVYNLKKQGKVKREKRGIYVKA